MTVGAGFRLVEIAGNEEFRGAVLVQQPWTHKAAAIWPAIGHPGEQEEEIPALRRTSAREG